MTDAGTDGVDRLLDEMVHLHDLQRRSYRRCFIATCIALVGFIACLVQLEPGARCGQVAAVAIASALFGLVEARDTRRASHRLVALGRVLRNSRL